MATYQLISSYTVGSGGVSSVTFSSIPATYTDLLLKVSARSSDGGVKANLRVDFNSSATNFSALMFGVQNASVFTQAEGATFANTLNYTVNAGGTTSNTFNTHETYITNYASSNHKSFSTETIMENDSFTTNQIGVFSGRWANSSAISSMYFYMNPSSNFLEHSTFYLYGIKNS